MSMDLDLVPGFENPAYVGQRIWNSGKWGVGLQKFINLCILNIKRQVFKFCYEVVELLQDTEFTGVLEYELFYHPKYKESQLNLDSKLLSHHLWNGEGNGTPLQYSCLENPMDGGAWQVAVRVVTKSQTRLSDFTSTFHFHALEKEMATHSSVLAWRIPRMGEPGGLPSMGSHRVGHN